ncbi:hypothetical protein M9H77_26746 [Catharanthus roseus]|uniref:Uncharacterized protein n=1 Tax=Catharanthus roseus TaxID=4058 RepID=A0ACC0AET7_CATRO|nr:hypothetical protein M9H77_26746 [Catharanthus roseus]
MTLENGVNTYGLTIALELHPDESTKPCFLIVVNTTGLRKRIALYVASPPYEGASSDGVDDLDSGEWIHLNRAIDRGECGPIGLRGHRIMLCGGVRPPSEESGGTRHREAALMSLDSLRLPSYARNPYSGSSISIVRIKCFLSILHKNGLVKLHHHYFKEITEMHTHVDSLSVCAHVFHFMFSSQINSGQTERADPTDSETVEGPAVQGVEPGVSVDEDPREAESDVGMLPEQEGAAPAPVDAESMDTLTMGGSPVPLSPICGYYLWSGQQVEAAGQQITELREEISRVDALFYTARQAHRQVAARSAMLEVELVQVREAHAAREREIQELTGEWDWLRRNMSDSRPCNYADKAMSENSQSRQPEPTRKNTPRPERATHMVVENFIIRMTELLETSMATRRNERFRPPEFYREAEQEIKEELFLEQLNDIYDTLRYEDALRVTFAGFRLQGMAKDWWLRASEARALKNQPWTWINFQEESKRESIDTDENKTRQFVKGLREELHQELARLPPMGFATVVEATTRTEMADQAVTQRKAAIGSAATPYKCPVQGPWKSRDFKRPHGEQRIRNGGRQTLTPGGVHRILWTIAPELHPDEYTKPYFLIAVNTTGLAIHRSHAPYRVTVLDYVDVFGSVRGLHYAGLVSDDLVLESGPSLLSPIVALHVSLHSGVEAALMCLDSLRFPAALETLIPINSGQTEVGFLNCMIYEACIFELYFMLLVIKYVT